MSWTRLDDGWTDDQILVELSHETRWHYLCMIQFCSRTKRFDGFIRAVDARRCSDVSNPSGAVQDLVDVGLVHPAQDGYKLHRMEEDHAPPVSVRNRAESNKQAQARHRAHKSGDHTLCLLQNCEHSTADGDSHADSKPDRKHDKAEVELSADSHADNVADTRTGQDRLRTKALLTHSETEHYPTDPKALQYRQWIEGNKIDSVSALMEARSMDEQSARKVWAQAYPESRAA